MGLLSSWFAASEVEVVEVVAALPFAEDLVAVGSDVVDGDLDLIVAAVGAPAERRATDAGVETFAVVFHAAGFAAVAAARMQFFYVFFLDLFELGLEGQRVFADCFLDYQLTQLVQSLLVVAVLAPTLRSAEAGCGEALAVQLQALGLAAGAAGALGGCARFAGRAGWRLRRGDGRGRRRHGGRDWRRWRRPCLPGSFGGVVSRACIRLAKRRGRLASAVSRGGFLLLGDFVVQGSEVSWVFSGEVLRQVSVSG